MTSHATTALLARDAALPGLGVILDPTATTDLLGGGLTRPYLRYKPGTSCVQAGMLRRPDGPEIGVVLRCYAESARAKFDKTLAKAPLGSVVAVDPDLLTVATRWDADRHLPEATRLTGTARDALAATLPRGYAAALVPEPRLLRHNPDRRAILRLGDGPEGLLARVLPRERVATTVHAYRTMARVPLRMPRVLGATDRGIVFVEWIDGTGADGTASTMRRAGAALARLHLAPVPPGATDRDAARGTATALHGVAKAIAHILPHAGTDAAWLATALSAPGPRAPRVLVHGDFSPDQVVLTPAGDLAVVDLDTAGVGDALDDVASFVAAVLCHGPDASPLAENALVDAFLDGYRQHRAVPGGLSWAVAGHVLRRSLDPFRRRHPDWAAELTERLATARDLAPRARTATSVDRLDSALRRSGSAFRLRTATPNTTGLTVTGEFDGRVAAGRFFTDPTTARRSSGRVRVHTGREPESFTVADGTLVIHRDGQDPDLPSLGPLVAAPGARLLGHRPGRRGVVRRADGSYTKVTAKALPPAVPVPPGPLQFPRVLAGDRHTVTTAALTGRTLHAWLCDPSTPEDLLDHYAIALGHGLRALHVPVSGLPEHDATAETRVTARWLDLAHDTGALDDRTIIDRVAGSLARVPHHDPTFVHRDLHDKQFLLAPESTGLLDLDLAALGHPALDLANLLVHLELRSFQGLTTPERSRRMAVGLLTAYAPGPAVRSALGAYALATRARLIGVYALRPGYPGLPAALLAALDSPVPGT